MNVGGPPALVESDAFAAGIALYADLPGAATARLAVQIEAGSLVIDGELAVVLPPDTAAKPAEEALPR